MRSLFFSNYSVYAVNNRPERNDSMEYLKVGLTALLSALALFILTKLMGHKQLAQLDVFDYVNGITIGSIAAEMATELEAPLKPFIALVVYSFIAVALSIISNKFPA